MSDRQIQKWLGGQCLWPFLHWRFIYFFVTLNVVLNFSYYQFSLPISSSSHCTCGWWCIVICYFLNNPMWSLSVPVCSGLQSLIYLLIRGITNGEKRGSIFIWTPSWLWQIFQMILIFARRFWYCYGQQFPMPFESSWIIMMRTLVVH